MLNNFHIAYFILNFVIFAQGEDIYTIVAPGTLHPYFKYNVAVSVHRAEGPCVIEVGITSPRYNTSKIINMLPMSIENVEFETMKLENDDYKLTIKGISGITIDNSTNLNFATYDPLVFIQTDKPVYGPGELVQFRIIFLDEYAHPEELKKTMYVVISDDAFNPIKIWRNISLTHGVYTGNFQISDTPIDNTWHIEVSDDAKKLQMKYFRINKYELPKFDVLVDVPSRVALTDEVVTITVRSKYTFGKPVKGKAYITIETSDEGKDFTTKKTIAIDGKGYIELNIWKDLPRPELITASDDTRFYYVYVTVEEALTGNKQKSQQRLSFNLYKENIVIIPLDSPKKFQPGKLIRYMISAKKFDGSPIQDNENLVELMVNDFTYYSMFNENGIATFNFVLREPVDAKIYYKYRNFTNPYPYTIKAESNDLPPGRFQINIRTEKPQLKKDLLIEDNVSKYENNIKKGIQFLIGRLDEMDDVYSLSITALVLQKVNHPLADEVLSTLMSISKNENGFTWWSIESKKQKRQISRVHKSTDIEITSYVLLAMLEKGSTENVLPIIKWLTMQRNSNGGFTSTQDTVVGLQALIKFAEKTGLSHTGSMDIEYISEGNGVEDKGTITIIPENLMMLNTHELPKNTRRVDFAAKGNTSSLVQLSYSYNTVDKGPEQSFRLDVNIRENTPPKLLIIDICAEFAPIETDSEVKKTNMIVIEADLPSGYTTGSENLQRIRDFKTILFTETKKSDTVAVIYLHSLEVADQKCISVAATKTHEVAKQKPVPVVIYDYYDKERRATEYYEIKSSLCEICKGRDCVLGCKKRKGISRTPIESSSFEI